MLSFESRMHTLTCLALVNSTGVLSLLHCLGRLVVRLAAAPLPCKLVQRCAEVIAV
jgi:hypothetical protein